MKRFSKKIKYHIIALSITAISLAVFGCNTKTSNSSNDEINGGILTASKTKDKSDSGCFNVNNYVEVLTLEEALESANTDFRLQLAMDYYIDFQRSIKRYGMDDIMPMWSQQWRFISVDNYRRFLSDTAACNHGEEPLKSFISRIVSDRVFFQSRIILNQYDQDDFNKAEIPSFKFYYKINPILCRGNICGTEIYINSWNELDENRAVFILTQRGYIMDSYTFTRINGHWFLTGYSPMDERNLTEGY